MGDVVKTSTRSYKGIRYKYVSIAELKKLLNNNGFRAGYLVDRDTQPGLEVFRHELQFVAGQAEIIVKHGTQGVCFYEIWYNGSVLLHGTLSVLVRDNTEDNIAYQCASKALPNRILSSIDRDKIRKKQQAARVHQIKSWTIDSFLNVVRTEGISRDNAKAALEHFRWLVKDEDLLCCSNWVISILDAKADQWASLVMQAYGTTVRTTVQLDTGINKYTTVLVSTDGYHTE